MSTVQGTTTDRFEPLRALLQSQLDSGADLGASVAVLQHGELVVDLWGGYVDAERTTPWQRDTIVNVWSTTKTMTFLVALMLSDQGALDLHAPVRRYWPDFAQNGKAEIEVRHVLGHTSGLAGWTEQLREEELADWQRCTTTLAAQAPWWTPGTASGYHALTQGYLVGEIVRRITGTTIGRYFASEVASVLDADFYIGLPESEEPRVSMVIPGDMLDVAELDPHSMAYRALTSPNLEPTVPLHRWWRAAEIPAANGHGNARSVATIQSIIANRGEINGHRFFSEATGEQIFETQSRGVDLVLGIDTHFGMGYGLSSNVTPVGPRACFWGGFGGSVVVMDQDLDLTVAYMMNRMQAGMVGDTRGANIALNAALCALA